MPKSLSKGKQFRWSGPMDRLMLETLANKTLKGNKPSSTFKNESFVRVAELVCEKFRCECTPNYVENHLRTLKNAWMTICKIREKSGMGWDNNLHMITCDNKVYDAEVTAHPSHEKYLNKKIDLYEEFALVVGKDIAIGTFAKSFADIDV